MLPRRMTFALLAAVLTMVSVSTHAATVEITIDNLVFSPAEATAKVGDTIVWINKDIFAHTATARNGDWDIAQPPKKSVPLVLKKAGSVDYYCRHHPNMKGTIVVTPQ